MLPHPNTLLDSMYSTKKLLKTFDLGYEKIHACVNDCCLFRKDLESLDTCPRCGASRWKVNQSTKKIKVGVLAKVLRYFSIIPILKRMFMSPEKSSKSPSILLTRVGMESRDIRVDSVWHGQVINNKWPKFWI